MDEVEHLLDRIRHIPPVIVLINNFERRAHESYSNSLTETSLNEPRLIASLWAVIKRKVCLYAPAYNFFLTRKSSMDRDFEKSYYE